MVALGFLGKQLAKFGKGFSIVSGWFTENQYKTSTNPVSQATIAYFQEPIFCPAVGDFKQGMVVTSPQRACAQLFFAINL